MPNSPDSPTRPAKRARLDSNTDTDTDSPSLPAVQKSSPEALPSVYNGGKGNADTAKEHKAGIVEFVCRGNAGWSGVLKQRYVDFQVFEIGLEGGVRHLGGLGMGVGVGNGKTEGEGNGKEGKKEGQAKTGEEGGKADVVMQDAPIETKATVKFVEENGADVKEEEVPVKRDGEKEDAPVEGQNGAEEEEYQISPEDRASLDRIFGETTTAKIVILARKISKHTDRKAKAFEPVITEPIIDKEVRTEAHQILRRVFPSMLESGMEPDSSIRIKARPPQQRGGNKRQRSREDHHDREEHERKGKLPWDERGGEYLHFNLYKENKDTMEVIGFLGSITKSGPKGFSFAGTKDKRACTVQRVAARRQTAQRMDQINKLLRNAAIGDFEYRTHDLGLGDLLGNEFVITLRDCHFEKEHGLDSAQRVKLAHDVVSKAVTDFSEKGFINYYGLQRFGTHASSTDSIGIKLLQNDLKGAVDTLLEFSPASLAASTATSTNAGMVSQDDRNRARGIDLWKRTGRGHEALKIIPKKYAAERNIIQHLGSRNSGTGQKDRGNDWRGALVTIPRNLRLMYVHAYQSLVWNMAAGKRWTTFGDKVVEGDLVLVNEHKHKEPVEEKKDVNTVDQDGEFIINPEGDDSAMKGDDRFERARALSQEEAASGSYSIFDIVLPQPGFDVVYPQNAIGTFYEEFMGSERGGKLDPHNMRRGWKDVSLSGGYRKVLSRPLKPMEFEIKEYTDELQNFVPTDLEKLQVGLSREENGLAEGTEGGKVEDGEVGAEEVKKIAVILRLQLASSQYATMALRELMKDVTAFKPEYSGR
ncbi:tRNA pseudouridine synthase D [Amniculicola lignicola CBS 123094]|uniref:tRNA pseudouridine synthase D n=1 Tax=Amniculicola lignicola CBS 123094 TaxID=1392246 RepID=A0A6A5W6B2_9PLEO|nr:tRNA pseudouridine synthase D [Amniculicola lignicola CBS 123094]